jgi:hypothetical protein
MVAASEGRGSGRVAKPSGDDLLQLSASEHGAAGTGLSE